MAHLQRALRERPDTQACRTLLTFALMQSERFEEVVPFCEVTLKIKPENWYSRLALGVALLQLGQLEQSISQLKSLIGNVPPEMSWQVSVFLAEALRKDGQSQEALQVFETIDLDKNPLLAGQLTETLCEMAELALQISSQETARSNHWRNQARKWLQLCLEVQGFDPSSWGSKEGLAVIRSDESLDKLSEAERQQWRDFWSLVDAAIETQSRSNAAIWSPISPVGLSTYSGAELLPQADRSLLAQGDQRPHDVYTLTFRADSVTAIRLELIPDQWLPNGGPGRGGSGTFELGEFGLDMVSEALPGRASSVAFSRCVTDRSVEGSSAKRCIDGNLQTAWRSSGESGASRSAVFVLEQPLVLKERDRLRLHLRHGGISGAGVGRFRVSVSNQPFAIKSLLPSLVLAE